MDLDIICFATVIFFKLYISYYYDFLNYIDINNIFWNIHEALNRWNVTKEIPTYSTLY